MQTFELQSVKRGGSGGTESSNIRLHTYRRKDGALVSVESYRPKRHDNPNYILPHRIRHPKSV